MFPTWDRFSVGMILESLVLFFGVLYLTISIKEILGYFDLFKVTLKEVLKFDEIHKHFGLTNGLINRIKSINPHTDIKDKNKTFPVINVDLITDSFIGLLNPILFLSVFYFLKVFTK